MNSILVVLGGGIGAVARHSANVLALRWFGAGFPVGTMLINILGCLAMGALSEYFAHRAGISAQVRLFLTSGALGGFTMFSAFSMEAVSLAQRDQVFLAAAYVAGSVVLALLAFVAGMSAVRQFP